MLLAAQAFLYVKITYMDIAQQAVPDIRRKKMSGRNNVA
jgi:hypothetical protein